MAQKICRCTNFLQPDVICWVKPSASPWIDYYKFVQRIRDGDQASTVPRLSGTTMPQGDTTYAAPQRVDKTVRRRIGEVVNMLQFAFANVTRGAGPAWTEAKRFSYDRIAMWTAVGSALPLLLVTAGVECPRGMMCGVVMSVVVGVFCSVKVSEKKEREYVCVCGCCGQLAFVLAVCA